MATALTALISSTLIVGLAVTAQLRRRRNRRRRLKGLELRPNCLLTRYPIAFISGPRSLFRLFDHWNDVPVYLREHGYEVLILEPESGSSAAASVLAALESLPTNCHLIADASQEQVAIDIARAKPAKAASITIIKNTRRILQQIEGKKQIEGKTKRLSVEDLRPLESAIEIFELNPTLLPGRVSKLSAFVSLTLPVLLLKAHNLARLGRPPVDPIETAEFGFEKTWDLESKFLDLAVQLAERDQLFVSPPTGGRTRPFGASQNA